MFFRHGQNSFRVPTNSFTYSAAAPGTVALYSRVSPVRGRFTTCPQQHPECAPGRFFLLDVPEKGLPLVFPAGTVTATIELERAALEPHFLLFLGLLAAGLALLLAGEARLLAPLTVLLCGVYFSVTIGNWRGLDVDGHLSHVLQILRHGWLVPYGLCWECFQPPGYYALAAAFLGLPGEITGKSVALLQGLSLLFHGLSVGLIVGALRPYASSRRALLLFSALVALWPAGLEASVRLGNDALLNLCFFAVLCLLARDRIRAAALVAGAAFFVKSSAVVAGAFVVAIALFRGWRGKLPARQVMFCGAVLGAAVIGSVAIARAKGFDGTRLATLPPGLAVANTASNTLLPDPAAYFREAFLDPWAPSSGRDHLWNYFWKSSLFGEWGYSFPGAAPLAAVIGALLLALLLLGGAILWRERPALPLLSLGLGLAAVLAYRLLYPFVCNADFRFVYPAVAFGISAALARARERRVALTAEILAGLFLVLSQAFFWLLFWSEKG